MSKPHNQWNMSVSTFLLLSIYKSESRATHKKVLSCQKIDQPTTTVEAGNDESNSTECDEMQEDSDEGKTVCFIEAPIPLPWLRKMEQIQ